MKPIPKTHFGSRSDTVPAKTRIGVGVIVTDAEGRVLLEQRSDCGLWGLPGGRVEPGETIDETARREVREETGLEIGALFLVGVYSEPTGRLATYPGDRESVHLIDIVVSAAMQSGALCRSSESEALRFFPHKALPANLAPPASAPLRDYGLGLSGVIG